MARSRVGARLFAVVALSMAVAVVNVNAQIAWSSPNNLAITATKLTVNGDHKVTGTLEVAGAAATGALTVSGAETITGTLAVNGAGTSTVAGALNVAGATQTGTLSVTGAGASTIAGPVTINGLVTATSGGVYAKVSSYLANCDGCLSDTINFGGIGTPLTFSNVDANTGGVTASNANTRFTVAKAGVYHVCAQAVWENVPICNGASTCPAEMFLRIGGAGSTWASPVESVDGAMGFCGDVNLSANQYVEIIAYQALATPSLWILGGRRRLSIHLVSSL